MGYFGHTCELPWMERPMGPCPACAYAREMQELAERAKDLRTLVEDASRVGPVLSVDRSRSNPSPAPAVALVPRPTPEEHTP